MVLNIECIYIHKCTDLHKLHTVTHKPQSTVRIQSIGKRFPEADISVSD